MLSIHWQGQIQGTSTLTGDSDSIDQPVASLSVGELGANDIGVNHGEGVSAIERHGGVGCGNGHGGDGANLCMC